MNSGPLHLNIKPNMTSMEAESVATIMCISKQTRFNIAVPNYREVR